MAYALKFTGSSRAEFSAVILSGDYRVEVHFNPDTVGNGIFLGNSDGLNWLGVFDGGLRVRPPDTQSNPIPIPVSGAWYTAIAFRVGSILTLELRDSDYILLGSTTVTSTSNLTFSLFGDYRVGGGVGFSGLLENCAIEVPAGVSSNLWDATSSDHSGSTAQPILTDTIGGNDATGVNFPAFDPSVWVFVGTPTTSRPWWLFQEED